LISLYFIKNKLEVGRELVADAKIFQNNDYANKNYQGEYHPSISTIDWKQVEKFSFLVGNYDWDILYHHCFVGGGFFGK
jgi:hypothetical protein